MDNFLDNMAKKLHAQDFIKANSEAEAARMRELELEVAEYEKILQEMRKLNYRNVSIADKLEEAVGASETRFQALLQEQQLLLHTMGDLSQEQRRTYEEELAYRSRQREQELLGEQQRQSELRELLVGFFQTTDDTTHKESVKVYRNVQAALIEELEKQTDQLDKQVRILQEENRSIGRRTNALLILASLGLLSGVLNIAYVVLSSLGLL